MQRDDGRYVLRSASGLLLAVAMIVLLGRCDLTEPVNRQSLVVEAFLATGDSLPTITLRQTRPLDKPGTRRANAAQGGTVELVLDGQSISYREDDQRPGRYVPEGGPETVPSQVPWRIAVQWKSETAQAHGTTPPPIALREMCVDVAEAPVRAIQVDSLRRDSLDVPAEQSYLYPVDVTLQWPANRLAPGADTTYWVRPQLQPDTTDASSRVVSFFLEPVEVRREDQFRVRGGRRTWTGVYAVPVKDSTSAFPRHTLTATLTRGDTSFAAFARSRGDPERREPISNVKGGLGIALAVALDSLRVPIVPGGTQCHVR
ncbi:MAG: DUF4249 family protein [Salinibacter sp.]